MLTIPLARLEREGTLEIQAAIPSDDPSWEGTELRLSSPIAITGQAQLITSGELLVRLRLLGQKAQECRRCLDDVAVPLDEELNLLFVPPVENPDELEEGVRILPDRVSKLELGEVVREEMILRHWPFALCREDCQGLCPNCGINRNHESCQCVTEELEPRWEALRALKEERD
jgi:uncharacterized protein